jgi:DNA-binding response OmpR family regulator
MIMPDLKRGTWHAHCTAHIVMASAPPLRPRVLVADDDTEMRRLVAESLRRDGYEVIEEGDGGGLMVRVAAIRSFDRTVDPFDLIVSDVRMPVCSGLDIVKGLREAHCTAPVILMTAFGDDETRAQAEALDAVLFDKPFQLGALRAVVRTLLADHAQRSHAAVDEPDGG